MPCLWWLDRVGAEGPFPHRRSARVEATFELSGESAGAQRRLGDGLGDLIEERPEAPAVGYPDADHSCADHDFGGDFHQSAAPGARMSFAEISALHAQRRSRPRTARRARRGGTYALLAWRLLVGVDSGTLRTRCAATNLRRRPTDGTRSVPATMRWPKAGAGQRCGFSFSFASGSPRPTLLWTSVAGFAKDPESCGCR